MKIKNFAALLLALAMMFSLCACGSQSAPAQDTPQPSEAQESAAPSEAPSEITVTDMIGRELTVTPAATRASSASARARSECTATSATSRCSAALRISTTSRLRSAPRCLIPWRAPMCLPTATCSARSRPAASGGPNAQAAEAEKILSCNPDIVISEYEDVEKEDALQEQLGVPVVTLKSGPNGVFDDAFSQSMTLSVRSSARREKPKALVSFIRGGGPAEIAEAHRQHCRRGQARRLRLRSRQLGHTNHLMTSQTYASFEVANIRNVVTDLGANGVQPSRRRSSSPSARIWTSSSWTPRRSRT